MYTYWKFYWPLALTGVGMVLSLQFQNATLARYPEAVTELAVLALAYGVFGTFNAGMQFIAQLSNVYARSPSCHPALMAVCARHQLLHHAAAGIHCIHARRRAAHRLYLQYRCSPLSRG